jgi:lysophospholipase L1-like esterase
MRTGKFFTVLTIAVILSLTAASSQNKPRFWDDVQTIKRYDEIYRPVNNPIVFVGSSSIRMWRDAEQKFAGYNILNRGIGGAVVNDIIFHANELILKYEPRQVVIYVGENDLGDGTIPADTIFARIKKLFDIIHGKMPEVPIAYISIKPSPGRDHAREILKETNELIRNYTATRRNIEYIDVYKLMINKDGSSKIEMFVSDKIHMTAEGYKVWEKAIKPYLLKNNSK